MLAPPSGACRAGTLTWRSRLGSCNAHAGVILSCDVDADGDACAVQVIPLAPAEMEDQLRLAVEELIKAPVKLIQALLDHSHGSYSQELYAAARQLERRLDEDGDPISNEMPAEMSVA